MSAIVTDLAEVVSTTGPDFTLVSEDQCVELATADLLDLDASDRLNFCGTHYPILQSGAKTQLTLVCISTRVDFVLQGDKD